MRRLCKIDNRTKSRDCRRVISTENFGNYKIINWYNLNYFDFILINIFDSYFSEFVWQAALI